MAGRPTSTRRERGSLSTEDILDAAFAVAGTTGVDGMSVPEVAKHMGVGVTSIYWHFRKKDDLVRSMSDRAVRTVVAALPVPTTGQDVREFLENYFRQLRDVHRRNDVLTDLTWTRIRSYSLDSTHVLYHHIEVILEFMIGAGFVPLTAWNSFSTGYTFTRGVVVGERIQHLNHSPILRDTVSKLLDHDTMPILSELLSNDGIMLAMVSDTEFDHGLRLILDGIVASGDARLRSGRG
ncbi:TetR family transcriptional regulator [Nakamurella sp. YIM 132087]|uniref:TetR family transcriptional regulator n=1 Tax=Nakamurella alba TaxID=2665158 RepID=A0A7K1FGK7_9ACTN|nr:TetR/AcrR family transcriptional regulator [Nakamurella alba]MTD12423.1 TetR family transcriptional regulator [Nakamurella alba]